MKNYENNTPRWLNYLALTTIVFSAAATLASFRGSSYSNKAVLSQNRASDNWAFFQAKSIKQHIDLVQSEMLSLELLREGAPKEAILARKAAYDEAARKYAEEKQSIEAQAHYEESVRQSSLEHNRRFSVAVIFLQIAITLSALAALIKRPALWLAGSVSGLVGLLYFANGFWLFF